MFVEIDNNSGFCFGVVNAVEKAEEQLEKYGKLYCLGEIVHNQEEVKRLEKKGLVTINHDEFKKLTDCKVLIRAHGEPPETYKIAKQNNIEIIDATCPVVLKLQLRIKKKYEEINKKGGQIIIYGKEGHAEVIGLIGQTENKAIVVKDEADIEKINIKKPIVMFSQTTMSNSGFENLERKIESKFKSKEKNNIVFFEARNTVCGRVSCREPALIEFSKKHDIIVFVSGKNSSNGKMLFEVCRKINSNSFFVSSVNDLNNNWFKNAKSVGVCGATSTPLWLMEKIANEIKNKADNQ